MPNDETDARARDAQEIADAIGSLLRGREPAVVEAAIGSVLSRYLCGHPDFMRLETLQCISELAVRLIEPNERELFGGHGHPYNMNKRPV